MLVTFSWRLSPRVFLAKRRIARLASQRGIRPKWVSSIGAIGIDPKHLSIWIAVDKDWERDELLQDSNFEAACREVLLRCGYPSGAVLFVGIAVESQQTVDRDSGGNWRWAMQ